jgi:anti-sigma factor RsiW
VSCDHAQWLHGYFDGELDAARAQDFEAHLEGCLACTSSLAAQQSLRDAFGAAELYAKAPDSLRVRLRAELPRLRAEAPPPRLHLWLALAAAVLLAFGGLWWTSPAWREDLAERQIASQVLDAHLRSLQPSHLTDVASTDQHTVKPWFVGKLDFAPAVVDLAGDGFPLVGGRLDVVGGQTVAALVYARRKHVINVFVWPSVKPDEPHRTGTQRGYTWARWTQAGMHFWVVSDVAAAELDEFVRLLSVS